MTSKPCTFVKFNPTATACRSGIQAVIEQYLPPDHHFQMGEREHHSLHGVQVDMKRVGNRSGIPTNAHTFLYTLSCEAFEAIVRCVWSEGRLHEPAITHTAVVSVGPEDHGWEAFAKWQAGL